MNMKDYEQHDLELRLEEAERKQSVSSHVEEKDTEYQQAVTKAQI